MARFRGRKTPTAEFTPGKNDCNDYPPAKRRRHPPGRGLCLPHESLLLAMGTPSPSRSVPALRCPAGIASLRAAPAQAHPRVLRARLSFGLCCAGGNGSASCPPEGGTACCSVAGVLGTGPAVPGPFALALRVGAGSAGAGEALRGRPGPRRPARRPRETAVVANGKRAAACGGPSANPCSPACPPRRSRLLLCPNALPPSPFGQSRTPSSLRSRSGFAAPPDDEGPDQICGDKTA
jgi:hypothetical protein